LLSQALAILLEVHELSSQDQSQAHTTAGLPNANYFPYDTLEASVATPNRFKPTPNDPVDPPTENLQKLNIGDGPSAARVLVPHDSTEKNQLRKIDLTTALQYGTAQGYPPLYYFIREFTRETLHPNVPYKDGPEVILTCGSTDGFAKSLEAFSNTWDAERDWVREREGILCEEFAYMNAIQAARPRGLNIVPVAIDDEGMCASGKCGLAEVLEKWDISKGKRPHLMYTVTMGQNPTSGLLSLHRRKEIYALCHKYDILIIEDDPYWYLQYPSANALSIAARGHPVSENFPLSHDDASTAPLHNYNAGQKSSGYPFIDSLVPSYLHVDTDGRVIRLDTFSKTVAPGCRLGWITAQPLFVEKILRITETSTQQPSGFVQSMIAELIMGPRSGTSDGSKGGSADGSGWKADGWVRWLEGLRGNYERRMQQMSSILEEGKYVVRSSARRPSIGIENEEEFQIVSKTQMYDFVYPLAGMFLWMHIHFETHPLFNNKKVPHARLSRALWVWNTMEPWKCLIGPGSIFCPTDEIREEKGWQYFRLCFAAVNDDVVEKYSRDVVGAFQSFWQIESVEKIDEILADDDKGSAVVEELQGMSGFAINPVIC
jgi:DNA-binding transcriptional MocR family regulator